MKHMVASLTIAAFAVGLLSASPFVSAAPNPSGTGPPNQTCQDFGSFVRPGAAGPLATGTSPGSVFNEPGAISGPGGGRGGMEAPEALEEQPTMRQVRRPNTTLPASNSP